jgi:hypothetical protein
VATITLVISSIVLGFRIYVGQWPTFFGGLALLAVAFGARAVLGRK